MTADRAKAAIERIKAIKAERARRAAVRDVWEKAGFAVAGRYNRKRLLIAIGAALGAVMFGGVIGTSASLVASRPDPGFEAELRAADAAAVEAVSESASNLLANRSQDIKARDLSGARYLRAAVDAATGLDWSAAAPPPSSDVSVSGASAPPPPWRAFAADWAQTEGKPAIAIIIDDVGLDPSVTARLSALPAPLTLSFLPYADGVREQGIAARAAGHEIMAHLPMEPNSPDDDPGPMALSVSHSTTELLQLIDWNLGRLEGYAGVNNHMGSRFTADGPSLAIVMQELAARGLFFLDSVTSPATTGKGQAVQAGTPFLARDVFLDPQADRETVRRQLQDAERIARETGLAVAIAHPKPETLDILGPWLVSAPLRGFALIPASQAVAISAGDEEILSAEAYAAADRAYFVPPPTVN